VGVGLWRLTVGGRGIDDCHEAGLWKVEVGYLLLEVIGVRLVGVVFGGLSGGGGRGLREVGLWEEGIIFGSGHCSCNGGDLASDGSMENGGIDDA